MTTRIALADPRITALPLRREGDVAFVKTGVSPSGVDYEIPIQADGTDLVFYPQRSASQKRLMAGIGIIP